MKTSSLLAAFAAIAALLMPPLVHAGEGHDHGDAAPTSTGPALPRFTAVSETFELVGVLNGKQITLYLDRAADNAPVTDAQIELEIAGAKLKAEKHEDAFEIVLAAEPKPGVLPITATVTAGQEVDLLSGGDGGRDRQYAGLGFGSEHDLEGVLVLFSLQLRAGDLQLDLRVGDGCVVGRAVEVQRDLLAVQHADQFEGLGDRREAGQRGAGGRRRSVAVVVAFAGVNQRGHQKGRDCSERGQER